jgi:hypothetical protein
MSKHESFMSIEAEVLDTVAGGKSSSDDQVLTTLTSISESIKDLGSNKNNTNDQLMPMMFMMMAMGGFGGGGGAVVAAPAPAAPTIIKVNARAGRGRKGW